MPWQETDAMQERLEFIVRVRQELTSVSVLCREFGISRKTGYKWLHRYAAGGTLAGVHERSRRVPERTALRTLTRDRRISRSQGRNLLRPSRWAR